MRLTVIRAGLEMRSGEQMQHKHVQRFILDVTMLYCVAVKTTAQQIAQGLGGTKTETPTLIILSQSIIVSMRCSIWRRVVYLQIKLLDSYETYSANIGRPNLKSY